MEKALTSNPGFPKMPSWFKDNKDWHKIFENLSQSGLTDNQIKKYKVKIGSIFLKEPILLGNN